MKKRLVVLFLAIGMVMSGCENQKANDVMEPQVSEESELEEQEIIESEQTEDTENIGNAENDLKDDNTAELEEIVKKESSFFAEFKDLEFYFASGAGGWRTVMQIKEDGSFSGQFSDSDMGSTGEGYSNGTYYVSDFEGKFTEPVMVNEYTYSMGIEEISYDKEINTEEIIDDVLYCYTDAYGLSGAEEILIYLPGAPIEELPEAYMLWVRNDMSDTETEELPFYGLYNVKEENGFSSYDISDRIDDMIAATEEWALTIKASLENDPLTQADMNMKSMELYHTWDAALNTLWTEIKSQISEEEFAVLLEEQRAWIKEKEQAVEEAGKEVEGGSIYSLVVNMKAAEMTEERVYELYELLK